MKATFIPNETLANLAKIAKPGEVFSLGYYPPGSVVVQGDGGLVVGEPDDDETFSGSQPAANQLGS